MLNIVAEDTAVKAQCVMSCYCIVRIASCRSSEKNLCQTAEQCNMFVCINKALKEKHNRF